MLAKQLWNVLFQEEEPIEETYTNTKVIIEEGGEDEQESDTHLS